MSRHSRPAFSVSNHSNARDLERRSGTETGPAPRRKIDSAVAARRTAETTVVLTATARRGRSDRGRPGAGRAADQAAWQALAGTHPAHQGVRAPSAAGSRPSAALTATTLAIVVIGVLLPFTPLAAGLGFTPLPPVYFAFLAGAAATYLMLVEIGKRFLMRKVLR